MVVHVGGRGPGHMARTSRRVSISTVAAMLSGVPSIILDPSDLTSMFTTNTGETQVASDGDTVGLALDVAQMGGSPAGAYIAAQTDLAVNGGFAADTDWTKGGGWAIGSGTANATAASSDLSQAILTVGSWYKITYTVSNYVGGTLTPKAGSGASGPAVSANGTYSTILRATTTTSLIFTAAAATLSIDNVSVKVIPGNHAFQATAGSRPLFKNSAGVNYLLFDGSDDGLATAAIDFSSTDAMSIFSGVRVIASASAGVLAELSVDSAGNAGVFAMFAPRVANGLSWRSAGSSAATADTSTTYTAPYSKVLTGLGDISTDTCIMRLNGTQATTSSSNQGTGNYSASQVLYIGRRAGASLPYNGYLYGLAIGGKLCGAAEINMIERWLNQQMGGGFL